MGLKITDFYSMRPKLPFRFKTDWFTGLLNKDDVLSYCVTSISVPKPEIENTLGFSTFGNAFISMPTFSPGHRRLDITFEETDDMYVIQFLDELLKRSYSKEPYHLTIGVHHYDEHFQHETIVGYVCHLSSYDEPQFKRDGQAQAINVTAKFVVDSIINNFSAEKAITGFTRKATDGSLNPDIDLLVVDNENDEFRFGHLKVPVDTSGISNSGYNQYRNANVKELRQQMKSAGVDTTSLSQVTEWLRNNTNYYSGTAGGRCASGVSLAVSIVEGKDQYTSHGNGNTYNINGAKKKQMSASEIDKKASNLKNGESFVISFKDLNDGKAGTSSSEEYGHVVIVSRDSTGQLTYTSDFKQNSWRTYGNIDTLIKNGAKFDVMET